MELVEIQNKIVHVIDAQIHKASPFIIGIDGRCASGKTSLSSLLSAVYGSPVVHMDDFFLRPEQRTTERLNTPGGNIDSERFLDEIINPIKTCREIVYRPFNCRTMTFNAPVYILTNPYIIIEGTYSCHPILRSNYDLTIFLTVNPQEQMKRIISRNGTQNAKTFEERWIPLEEKYFKYYQIQENCSTSFDTNA